MGQQRNRTTSRHDTYLANGKLKLCSSLVDERKLIHGAGESKNDCFQGTPKAVPSVSLSGMADTRVWIGIDGGGTKTKAYLIDAEKKLVGTEQLELESRPNVFGSFFLFVVLTRLYLVYHIAETSVSSSNQNSVGFEGATRALTEACEILMSNRSKNSRTFL